MDREINEMKDLICASSPIIDGTAIANQAQIEAEKLDSIGVDLNNISDEVGVEKANKILENIFRMRYPPKLSNDVQLCPLCRK